MRQLILLRHAKSSWVNPDLNDFDRPLNKRGQRSAKTLGKWLRKSGYAPEVTYCSTARRTRETWEALKLDGSLQLMEELYHASPDRMLGVLHGSEASSVLMIAHNPGISALAHVLVDTAPDHPRFADYPTGSLLVLEFDVESFSKVTPHSGHVREFLTPHDLLDPPT